MSRRGRCSSRCWLLAVALATPPLSGETLTVPGFGPVDLRADRAQPAAVVLVLADQGSWSAPTSAVRQELAAAGAWTITVDVEPLLRRLGERHAECAYPAGDLEEVAELVERRSGLPRYLPPLLAGTGRGAALAYALGAQAPLGTFPGLLTLGFSPALTAAASLCPGRGLRLTNGALAAAANFAPQWVALDLQPAAAVRAFLAAQPAGRLSSIEVTGWSAAQLQAALTRAASSLIAASRGAAAETLRDEGAQVRSLPLLSLPASGAPTGLTAVLVSGDGGLRGIDRKVAKELASRGTPVMALDSQRYFWSARTPAELAGDLAEVVRQQLAACHCLGALLFGYSAGADALALAMPAFPSELRHAVRLVALLSPSRSSRLALFTALLPGQPPAEREVLPALRQLEDWPLLCLSGESDGESPCRALPPRARAAAVHGGHALGGDAVGLARRLLTMAGVTAPP